MIEGEPTVGLDQDPRRARQAWHQDLGEEDSLAAAGERGWGRLPDETVRPGASSSGPRRGDPCPRLLHGGDGHASNDVRAVGIHLGSRRVHVLGVTKNPDSAWVTQQARNLVVGERLDEIRFVIRDRDLKLPGPFDEVFRSEGIRIIDPDSDSPRERVRRAVGPHGPDGVPGLDSRARPSPPGACASGLRKPITTGESRIEVSSSRRRRVARSSSVASRCARVRTRDVLGGLIHEYDLAA